MYQAFAGLAAAQPALLPPTLWDERLIAAFVFDDKTFPAGDPRHLDVQYSAGETVGMTSWNRWFPHRPRLVSTQYLGVTSVGGTTDETTYRIEIEYDPPYAARNRRLIHTTVGPGERLLPVHLPPLPSRAVVTAWQGNQVALAPWVIPSADYWQVPREPEDPEAPFVALRHTFEFAGAAPALRVSRNAGGTIELTWPATAVDWQLEESPTLAGLVAWVPVAGEPELVGDSWRFTRPAAAVTMFYRLRTR
jgi:hypothetical protein